MIVPRPRLLFWVSGGVLPLAVLAATAPHTAATVGVLVTAFALLVLADAVRSGGRREGLRVELPDLVRLTQDRQGTIEVQVHNASKKKERLRIGLALPHAIGTPSDVRVAELPEGAAVSRLQWPCTARRRGRYRLERCSLEISSRFGFWDIRWAAPARSEIHVYPNLLAESRSVGALFLNRGTAGIHSLRQVGKGREFEKLREYIPGDSYDDIHWKATAKRGHPITKVFQIERTQEVYVVIDASRLSARASGEPPVPALERFITAALILALAAERQDDLFGLLAFSNRVQRFVRARRGKTHFDACREALFTLQPQIVTPDFEETASFIRLRLRRRALLVFLTELDDPVLAESFLKSSELFCRQHLVLVHALRPANVRPLFSDADVSNADDVYRKLAGHVAWQSLDELSRRLKQRGIDFSVLENESLCAGLVSRYLGVKRRQLL
ncbi:MAG: DUF58 domain-containing protein [Acidobacteriota bacterium]